MEEKQPIVFISYSWDSDEHKAWVLQLAEQLAIQGGVFVLLDQYELKAGRNLNHFMEESIEQADKVILVLTEKYKAKADDRTGGGGYEYSMINREWGQNIAHNKKYIPVLRQGDFDTGVPRFVQGALCEDMRSDAGFEDQLQRLVKNIYEVPMVDRPTSGKRPDFLKNRPQKGATPSTTSSFIKERKQKELEKEEEKLADLQAKMGNQASETGGFLNDMREMQIKQSQEKIALLQKQIGLPPVASQQDFTEEKQAIRKWVSQAYVDKALAVLMEVVAKKADKQLEQEADLLSSRYNQLQREKRMGILSQREENIQGNQIISTLLELAQQL